MTDRFWSLVWSIGMATRVPRVRAQFAIVLAKLALAVFSAPSSAQACVVGTGTGTCSESALNACLLF